MRKLIVIWQNGDKSKYYVNDDYKFPEAEQMNNAIISWDCDGKYFRHINLKTCREIYFED